MIPQQLESPLACPLSTSGGADVKNYVDIRSTSINYFRSMIHEKGNYVINIIDANCVMLKCREYKGSKLVTNLYLTIFCNTFSQFS